jgi:putative oxidoreductase
MTDIGVENNKLFVPALGTLYEKLAPLGWPLVRIAAGVMLVPHGAMKLFGGMAGTIGFFSQIGLEPAALLAWYVALLEFVGGILLAAGFLTRVVAAQIVVLLAVAVTVHWGNGFAWTQGGYEYPLMWGAIALAILFRGAGPLSVDALLGREI